MPTDSLPCPPGPDWAKTSTSATSRTTEPPTPELNILAVGGGTGLAALLSKLKHHVGDAIDDLAAIVAVTDDGGSSGRLRRDLGVLPPGDIRNCLAALADDTDLVTRLFQFRFGSGGDLA